MGLRAPGLGRSEGTEAMLHCFTYSHFHIFGYDSVLFFIHYEGFGKRFIQAGSHCGNREDQVRKIKVLTLDNRTDILFLRSFFEIEDRLNVTIEI